MTGQPTAWTLTGVWWPGGRPTLTAARPDGREHARLVYPGVGLTLHLDGPRTCVGVWDAGVSRRRACPASTPVPPAGRNAQCDGCAVADPGRRLASDRASDGRLFGLYLAWFGPDLVKVGISARGDQRLLEQGALAHTWLAHGSHAAVRRAERHLASTGHGRERLPADATAAAWWDLPPAADRAAALAAAAGEAVGELGGIDGLTPLTGRDVVDNVAAFGLDRPPPDRYDDLTGVVGGATLAGTVLAVVGRRLLLGGDAPILVDSRLAMGWAVSATPAPHRASCQVTVRRRPTARQDALPL